MRIVVDTNVLVSGLLSPFGPPGFIVGAIAKGTHRVCCDARILGEYHEVLRRPAFAFRPTDIQTLLSRIATAGELLSATPLRSRLPDANDQPFLEVAVSARAEHLVTGNLKHFPKSHRQGVRVVSPRDFLEATIE